MGCCTNFTSGRYTLLCRNLSQWLVISGSFVDSLRTLIREMLHAGRLFLEAAACGIHCLPLANFPFSLLCSQLGSVSRKKPASYVLRRTHIYREHDSCDFFCIISLLEKRRGMQARICNSSRRAGYIGERHALLYIIVVCAIPSADMRYLITLTPSGNKNKEKSADTRAWASELRPGSMNMQETPC